MVRDAESHAGDDKKKKEEVTTRNETDQLIYQTEKNINELGDKLDADTKAKLEAAVERAKEAMKSDNIEEIISARDGLNTVWHEAASNIYEAPETAGAQPQGEPQAKATGGTGAGGGDGSSGDDSGAVDADFEVVDD